MIKLFIKEFCTRQGLIPVNKRARRRYAFIIAIDTLGRSQGDFIINRKCLPANIQVGERISIINQTEESEKSKMSAADSVKIGPLTAAWQNLWDLCAAKYAVDGIPMFEKFARTLNLEAPRSANNDIVQWSRTSIGDNPAGELAPGESIQKITGGALNNENTYNIYVRGDGQYLFVERTQ